MILVHLAILVSNASEEPNSPIRDVSYKRTICKLMGDFCPLRVMVAPSLYLYVGVRLVVFNCEWVETGAVRGCHFADAHPSRCLPR